MEQKKIVKEVGLYFILTFLITWLLWLPSVLNAMDYQVPVFLLIISMMASFTPSIVGLILLKRSLGDQFKVHLKERFSLRFNKLWLFIIPIYFFATGGLSYYLTYVFDQGFNPTNVPLFGWYLWFFFKFYLLVVHSVKNWDGVGLPIREWSN